MLIPLLSQDFITTKNLSVRELLNGKHDLGYFDLINAAGLYDYLDARTAETLTSRFFDLLKEGGTLIVANFLKEIWEYPYMEVYMKWNLIYRTRAEIARFLSKITGNFTDFYFEDPMNCIGYLEVTRGA